ncbi:MAG: allantoinase AllB [Solirubrobacterales bacterium]
MAELAVVSRRVLGPDGPRPAAVLIEGGRIAGLADPQAVPAGCPVLDAGNRVVMPGLVDAHVHINEPGRTEWEGFLTATRAAAAGGVTTLVDMPLNSVPATTGVAALEAKLAAARGRLHVDCGFWGGVVPGNAGAIEGLVNAGVPGFKCFLVPSGVDEFEHVGEADLRLAMPILARLGVPLLVHAELEGPVAVEAIGATGADLDDPSRYAGYLASRPPSWETEAIRLMARLSGETGCRVHIVHLSSAEALPILSEARGRGLPITVETCPHYLFFAAEDIKERRTEYKCSPPIRERANRERLWAGLGDGTIDMVVSDHSPCTPELKGLEAGDFQRAWGGIASLQFRLAVVWKEAQRRGFGLEHLVRWMCRRPAELAGLAGRKGALEPGYDADLVIWDPDAAFELGADAVLHRHAVTPYRGQRLLGVVETTLLRGVVAYDRGSFPSSPRGDTLLRGHDQPH